MGRLSSVILLLAAFGGIRSAPTTTIIHQPATQYYLLQPQSAATVKIQQHLIQPIQHLKLEPKQELIYYYPSIPLSSSVQLQHHEKPIRLVSLKQQEPNWFDQFLNFFQPTSTEKPAAESPTEAPGQAPISETSEAAPMNEADSTTPAAMSEEMMKMMMMQKQQMFMSPADVERLPTKAGVQSIPNRYYILTGTPQFYGNFDALQNPLSPIFSLQPLQAIHARNPSSDILAAEDDQQRFQPQIVSSLAPIAPVPAPVPAQLKNDLLESHPDKVDRTWGRSLAEDDEPEPEQEQQNEQPQIQRRADEEELPMIEDEEEDKPQQQQQEQEKATGRQSDDPSVAAVKPAGIAIAGKGGLAASSPTGTAITGANGLALANPSATSVAGNFFDDDIKA
ncbi:uncharacterized protein LOC129756154 [Uranotaenia lowii]|uniref:uncharacterized protein LOC129756154 n=1 Tax=Uranotaenia lowii TaxID=190385 RepID=UPI00247A3CD9|nr:uncharacterized protein LOC129756154 [Uranotaenia lowii]